jgi:hypothetical protein
MQVDVRFAKKIPIVKIVYSVNMLIVLIMTVQHIVRAPKKVIVVVLTVIAIPVVRLK